MQLKIGISREIITPKLGGLFAGYGAKEPSDSVHDDLAVTALALEYGQMKVLLINAAVCLISNELFEELRERCGKAAGVDKANVLVSTTHTHSGPVTTNFGTNNTDTEGNDYCSEILIPRSIAAAGSSVREMKPVKMGIAVSKSMVGINRRKLLEENKVILGHNPWGIYDPEMTVISFRGEDGKPAANLIHYAAHCTAAGRITSVSRDWCGVMIDRLEKESGAMTVFFNGCAGDVAPRISKGQSAGGGTLEYVIELGSVAAADAVRTYKDIREYRDADLATARGEIHIPYDPIKPLDQARKEYAAVENGTGRWDGTYRRILSRVIEMHEKGETGPADFVFNQTLVRLGPAVLAPVPFEAFSEISLRMRAYSKFGYTLALGYTNGSNSYLPTQDQICKGGYEVERFLWAMPRQLPADTDTKLINANLKIMEGLL